MAEGALNIKTKGSVLYLSYDGLTDPLGQSQVLPYLEGLAGKGYKITVVSFEKPVNYKATSNIIKERCRIAGLIWEPLSYHKDPPVLSTLLDLSNLRRIVTRLHKRNNFSIVHCRSYITSLIGLWMKRKYSIRFLFDMRGFWADERVEGKLWNLANPLFAAIYKFFKKKEMAFFTGSDHIISLTQNAAREISSWNVSTPVTIIPCCVDTRHFDPEKVSKQEQIALKDEIGVKPNDFLLLYLGSWGTWYMTTEMLLFFSELKKANADAKFLILSPDQIDIKNHPYAQDIIVRSVPRRNVPLYVSIASAAVFFIKPTFSKKASSATKMGELLAMNIPVITNTGWGDVSEISRQTNIFFKENIAGKWSQIQPSGTRSFCLRYLSLEEGVNQYMFVYERLLSLQ